MFIIHLKYIVPLEKVDEFRDAHIQFLKKYYSKDVFVASGPKVPRSGGVIMADQVTRQEIESLIKEDPFYINNIAEYDITEFNVTMGGFKS